MLPKNRISTHPGEILNEEFLKPTGITQSVFAEHIGVPFQRINEVVNGKRGITPETAWLFSEAFGTTPEFWTNLQAAYDLTKHRLERHVKPIRTASKSTIKRTATSAWKPTMCVLSKLNIKRFISSERKPIRRVAAYVKRG
jgi:antitoxin HigA-1